MNDISILTKEEKATLCTIIGGRYFKELFKKDEKAFQKIKKGFRAKSLKEEYALSIAVSNSNEPFIIWAINNKVDIWLKEIQENIDKLENEGEIHEVALLSTMIDSYFADNIELYFKLIEQPLDDETCERFRKGMEYFKAERVKKAEIAEHIKALEEEVAANSQSIESIKEEYKEKIQIIEQEKSDVETLHAKAKEKIIKLQTISTNEISNDTEYLSSFDDRNPSALPSLGSDETVSLCKTNIDYEGIMRLNRCADLNHTGKFSFFQRNESIPPFFTNRDRIYYKDGPSDEGVYGIWIWSTSPNKNDPTKDYVTSQFDREIDAIEVVVCDNVSNLEALITLLKDGIEYQSRSRRVMFAFYTLTGQYVGVLCNSKELSFVRGKAVFADDVIVAPVYEFTDADILRLDNDVAFYRSAFAGIPTKLYRIKSPLEIVKDTVWKSISWQTFKSRGALSHAQYRDIKDFLTTIPVNDILGEIQMVCRCSAPVADDLLKQYVDLVNEYVDGNTLEDEIILSAISASDELQIKTKQLIRADWERENEILLGDAQSQQNELNDQLRQIKIKLDEAKASLKQIKSEEERVSGIISEKEKLAEDVETTVAEKIESARNNVAEFIANMAFVGGPSLQVDMIESTPTIAEPPASVVSLYHVVEAVKDDDLKIHKKWSEVINTVVLGLQEAGVNEQFKTGLAAFLCAAFIEKQPILLIGPNALDIIEAFSTAVSAQQYGVLNCEGDFSRQAIDAIGSDGERIVAINNFLTGGWMNRLPEILSQKDIFFIATHPYAEDIQVEPKSMYNFMTPLFTEFFIDQKATGKYFSGGFADDFEGYVAPKEIRQKVREKSKLFSFFNMNALIKNRISLLVATMHSIDAATITDDDFLFAVLPFAYATMDFDALDKVISDPQNGIMISENLRRDLKHILGEIQ